MSSSPDSSNSVRRGVDLVVQGTAPSVLSGRLVGVGRDGVVHVLDVRGGRVSYRPRRLHSDVVVHDVIVFDGLLLAIGDDSLTYELSADLGSLHRVDLAGRGRTLAGRPTCDAATGELHLVTVHEDGAQEHVVVSAGALTRRTRPVVGAAGRIHDLALTGDRVVFVTEGFVGVAPRDGDARTAWIATGAATARPVRAFDAGEAVVLLAVTPALERWTLHPGTASLTREVLERLPHLPAAFVVADPAGTGRADAGWILGLSRHPSGATDLIVLDAAALTAPAVASARLPQRVLHELRCAWIPATDA